MEGHFVEFKRCREHWGIQDKDIYNFDQVGCMIGIVSGSLVVVLADCKEVFVDDPYNRELVIITKYISVGGYYLPPMIIYKGAYYLRKYFKNDIDGDIL